MTDPAYEDVATKFFEHFIYIADAINGTDGRPGLWNDEDGFFYDVLHLPDGHVPAAADPVVRRTDPAVRGRDARAGGDREAAPGCAGGWSGSSAIGLRWRRTSRP